ncbi:MAG: pyrroline-5-carboxylate reductase [Firmicutes bacterium]|nr:pyrroline-5-carboxylate reductase [Bacillota bacterium]
MKKLGFIGMGNMAQALVKGFVASGKVKGEDVYAYAPTQDKLARNCESLGINHCLALENVVDECDTIFVACKPYQIEEVVSQLGKKLCGKSILSVAASWDFDKFKGVVPASTKIQCIMPNTPVAVAEGVLLVAEENDWDKEDRNELMELLGSVGRVVELPTRLMDAGMAISGCGPAFVDMIIEALADGAVKNGLQRAQAYQLVSQTLVGSAKLQLETGKHPGQLKDEVCSPGGWTIKGVASLEKSGIRTAFIEAIDAILE